MWSRNTERNVRQITTDSNFIRTQASPIQIQIQCLQLSTNLVLILLSHWLMNDFTSTLIIFNCLISVNQLLKHRNTLCHFGVRIGKQTLVILNCNHDEFIDISIQWFGTDPRDPVGYRLIYNPILAILANEHVKYLIPHFNDVARMTSR